MKAFAGWFFKYIITPLIATFVIGFILSSLKIAPLFYLAYPIYVVGGSFLALIVIAAIGLWGWHRERLKNFRKIFPVYKPVSKLKPEDFGIFSYNEFYVSRESDKEIENSLNAKGLAFITGVPNLGKTRGAYELAKKQKGLYLMKPPYEKIEVSNLKFPFFKKRIVVLLDDLDKYMGKLNVDQLIHALKANSKDVKIIITCRSGSEYDRVVGQKEMETLFSRCHGCNAKPRLLEEKEQQELAEKMGKEWKEVETDGTPGSIVLGLSKMKQRYNQLPAEAKRILHVLKLLRVAGIFVWTEELVKKIAESELFELKLEKYKWNELLNLLQNKGFIKRSNPSIQVAHDSYLDDEFVDDYNITQETLIELKEKLFSLQEADGLFYLGSCFYSRKNLEEALDCLKRAIKISPDIAEAHYNLGVLLLELNRPEEAEKEYREAIRSNPDHANAHHNLGVLIRNLNRLGEAEKELREAIRVNPNGPNAHNNLGTLLADLNRPEEAEKELREAIRINPGDASAHYNLGNLLEDLNRPEEAEKEYKEAIRINPGDASAHYNLGNLLKGLKRPEEAEKEYRDAIRINPDHFNAHYNLGILLADLNRPEEAEIEYREAIRINPDYAEARGNLGILCQALGKLQEAKIELLAARDIFKKQGREGDAGKAENLLKNLENQ